MLAVVAILGNTKATRTTIAWLMLLLLNGSMVTLPWEMNESIVNEFEIHVIQLRKLASRARVAMLYSRDHVVHFLI